MSTRTISVIHRIGQYLQLARSHVLRLRGAKIGRDCFLGRDVKVTGPRHLTLDDGVIIWPKAYINCISLGGVRIGAHTTFHLGLWLDCGSYPDDVGPGFFEIGAHSFVGPYAIMGAKGGGIRIGSHVQMGQMVSVHAENHRFDDVTRRIDEQGTVHKGVVIEDDCWIGTKAIILDGVTVGCGSVIGAGAVVSRCIPPYSVAVGNPARVIRRRGQRDKVV